MGEAEIPNILSGLKIWTLAMVVFEYARDIRGQKHPLMEKPGHSLC